MPIIKTSFDLKMPRQTINQEILRNRTAMLAGHAKEFLESIRGDLPELVSDLYVSTVSLAALPAGGHPIDNLMEFRLVEGKIAIALQRLENEVNYIKRRAHHLSSRAGALIKDAAWTPEDLINHYTVAGGKVYGNENDKPGL